MLNVITKILLLCAHKWTVVTLHRCMESKGAILQYVANSCGVVFISQEQTSQTTTHTGAMPNELKQENNMEGRRTQDQISKITTLCKKFADITQVIEKNQSDIHNYINDH